MLIVLLLSAIGCSPYHIDKEFAYEFRGTNENPVIYKYHGSLWVYYRDTEIFYNMPYKRKNWHRLNRSDLNPHYVWVQGKWVNVNRWSKE